jgi:hypothetical protein
MTNTENQARVAACVARNSIPIRRAQVLLRAMDRSQRCVERVMMETPAVGAFQ